MAPHSPGDHSTDGEQHGGELVDYGDAEQYFGRSAVSVALELFGEDLSYSGVLYSENREGDVSYRIVCRDGQLMTYNMLHGTDTPAAGQGLHGRIVSRSEANEIANAKLSYRSPFRPGGSLDASRSDTDR